MAVNLNTYGQLWWSNGWNQLLYDLLFIGTIQTMSLLNKSPFKTFFKCHFNYCILKSVNLWILYSIKYTRLVVNNAFWCLHTPSVCFYSDCYCYFRKVEQIIIWMINADKSELQNLCDLFHNYYTITVPKSL